MEVIITRYADGMMYVSVNDGDYPLECFKYEAGHPRIEEDDETIKNHVLKLMEQL